MFCLPLCCFPRSAFVGTSPAAVFSCFRILTGRRELPPAQRTDGDPRRCPVGRIGMPVMIRKSALLGAEAFRSASAYGFKDLPAGRTHTGERLCQILVAVPAPGFQQRHRLFDLLRVIRIEIRAGGHLTQFCALPSARLLSDRPHVLCIRTSHCFQFFPAVTSGFPQGAAPSKAALRLHF